MADASDLGVRALLTIDDLHLVAKLVAEKADVAVVIDALQIAIVLWSLPEDDYQTSLAVAPALSDADLAQWRDDVLLEIEAAVAELRLRAHAHAGSQADRADLELRKLSCRQSALQSHLQTLEGQCDALEAGTTEFAMMRGKIGEFQSLLSTVQQDMKKQERRVQLLQKRDRAREEQQEHLAKCPRPQMSATSGTALPVFVKSASADTGGASSAASVSPAGSLAASQPESCSASTAATAVMSASSAIDIHVPFESVRDALFPDFPYVPLHELSSRLSKNVQTVAVVVHRPCLPTEFTKKRKSAKGSSASTAGKGNTVGRVCSIVLSVADLNMPVVAWGTAAVQLHQLVREAMGCVVVIGPISFEHRYKASMRQFDDELSVKDGVQVKVVELSVPALRASRLSCTPFARLPILKHGAQVHLDVVLLSSSVAPWSAPHRPSVQIQVVEYSSSKVLDLTLWGPLADFASSKLHRCHRLMLGNVKISQEYRNAAMSDSSSITVLSDVDEADMPRALEPVEFEGEA